MADGVSDYSDVYKVTGVQFSILSPDEIIQNSVASVFQTDINEGSSIDQPKCNGVNDPRMGPSHQKSSMLCPTDDNTFKNCPGYFGHIQLAKPVFWPQYMSGASGGIIKTILRYVCYNCSSLLIDNDPTSESNERAVFQSAQRLKGRKRYVRIKDKIKVNQGRPCPKCHAPKPNYVVENNTRLIAQFKTNDGSSKRHINFSAERVRTIFSRMLDEDIEALGFSAKYSRPEWMICTVFPVPPPAIRPSSMRVDTSQRSEDDLTIKLLEIIKFNKELAKKLQSDATYTNIEEYVQLLQVHVAAFVNNDVNSGYKVMRKSNTNVKSLVSRFKGKTGRIRGNLLGKRANFSARSVITGDPSISVEEVGVPAEIAMNLTYPEIVTKLNVDWLTKLVRNGPNKYPGAKSIKKRGSKSSVLQQLKPLQQLNQLDRVELKAGDTVNRHLLNGDLVLFNRQPSLHRMSMMAHRVRVLKGRTFRLQLAVVKPYNADFDGDDMLNLVPNRRPLYGMMVTPL